MILYIVYRFAVQKQPHPIVIYEKKKKTNKHSLNLLFVSTKRKRRPYDSMLPTRYIINNNNVFQLCVYTNRRPPPLTYMSYSGMFTIIKIIFHQNACEQCTPL